MGKTRDSWRKAMRIICLHRHQKECTVLESCNGNYCNNMTCHADGEKVELVLDHRDNNKYNDDPDNIQLHCHSCNQSKSPKHLKPKRNTGYMGERSFSDGAMAVDEGVRQRAIDNNPQMAISQDLKTVYRSMLRQGVKRPQGLKVVEAIYGFAKKLDISPVTTRRMLMVETESEDGIYEKKKRGVPMIDGIMKAFTFLEFRPAFAEAEAIADTITGPAIRPPIQQIEAPMQANMPLLKDAVRMLASILGKPLAEAEAIIMANMKESKTPGVQ